MFWEIQSLYEIKQWNADSIKNDHILEPTFKLYELMWVFKSSETPKLQQPYMESDIRHDYKQYVM